MSCEINQYMPKGEGAKDIEEIIRASWAVLQSHPVNRARIDTGKKPANSIWLWGQGRAPHMKPLGEKFSLKGGIISAVNLLNGIGVYAGLEVINVPGATGYTDTDYASKARYALEALEHLDFMFVHVEAPDEMGHEGNIFGKVKAIEDFDKKVVGNVLKGISRFGDYRVLVLSDHPTPIRIKTHSSGASPFAVFSSRENENLAKGWGFGEAEADCSGLKVFPVIF